MNRILNLKEVAAYLRIHPSTVYRLLKKKEIPAFKIGHKDWRFELDKIDEWCYARRLQPIITGADECISLKD